MLFMVIECFRDQNAKAIYRRLRQQGRLMPDGIAFAGSWVTADLSRCFQLMECDDITLLQRWVAEWSDLIEFEILPVVQGKDTAAALSPQGDEPEDATPEPRIRTAIAADVPTVAQIVADAYRQYIPRIGKPPGPMLDDYSALVSEGVVWVIEEGTSIVGILVLLAKPDHLLLDNIAVVPSRQGFGLGRQLLAFAEAEALRRGYREIRLYTHATMTENQQLYAAIGYEETGRGTEAGYERVFMRKQLCA